MRDLGKAVAGGVCVFLMSLPLMYAFRNLAVFTFGFGLWFIPWGLGAVLWPQGALGGFIETEFDGAAYGFVLFGAVQNAILGAALTYAVIVARRHAAEVAALSEADL